MLSCQAGLIDFQLVVSRTRLCHMCTSACFHDLVQRYALPDYATELKEVREMQAKHLEATTDSAR